MHLVHAGRAFSRFVINYSVITGREKMTRFNFRLTYNMKLKNLLYRTRVNILEYVFHKHTFMPRYL